MCVVCTASCFPRVANECTYRPRTAAFHFTWTGRVKNVHLADMSCHIQHGDDASNKLYKPFIMSSSDRDLIRYVTLKDIFSSGRCYVLFHFHFTEIFFFTADEIIGFF